MTLENKYCYLDLKYFESGNYNISKKWYSNTIIVCTERLHC